MSRKKTLVGVITGDIINSRNVPPRKWLPVLKRTLARQGRSPAAWEIYRGDSFQLEVKNPSDALLTAIRVKANLKRIKGLDVRMAIGIGGKEFTASKITQSNGEAFIYSGEKLESLKKEKQNIAVKSRWADFDREMNVCLNLAAIAMDNWSTGAADLITILVDKPDITQVKLARKLKITQSAVSGRQKRSYYNEVRDLEALFRERIQKLK
jgi:hypothetical protein